MSSLNHQFDGDQPRDGLPDASADGTGQTSQQVSGSSRKTRQRSVYLFPAYGFTTALDIAHRVEESGGGALTEETLAISLGLSAKSSGFRLKSLAARQFQLISKHGDTLTTTPVAKAIFKPTSNEDALRGYREAFMSIPLFKAVADRYRGQRLPDSQTMRNVLEREFQVETSRVQQAERILLDSARDAHLLKHRGDGTYLFLSDGIGSPEENGAQVPWAADLPNRHNGLDHRPVHDQMVLTGPANVLTFTVDEIGDLDNEEFETVWQAIGILVRARRRHRPDALDSDDFE